MSKKEKRDFPGAQPFNINGRRNLLKQNSWWQRNPPQNNTQNRKKRDD
jgi:hypothetical protein